MSKKLHVSARISQFREIHKRRTTMRAFIASEFGYHALIWVFPSRKLNSRVNKFHKGTLKIVYQDYASSFTELLQKDTSTTIHNRNIQLLAPELHKVKNTEIGPSPLLMNEIFVENAQYYYDLTILTGKNCVLFNLVQTE